MSLKNQTPIEIQASPNHDARTTELSHIILHYTDMDSAQAALERMCDPAAKVSAHYLIHRDGQIVQLVEESRRAWHAGVASWRGESDMNSASIGIELDHQGHDAQGQMAAFPKAQRKALYALLKDIITRNNLDPRHVIGHSDIAPGRKVDPGEAFDWAELHEAGFGLWLGQVKQEAVAEVPSDDATAQKAILPLQKALAAFGYLIEADGTYGAQMHDVVCAFQRHYRPSLVTGIADAETQSLIYAYCRASLAKPSAS
jgi:N-acetylmuramoyl-L-alanine amidase